MQQRRKVARTGSRSASRATSSRIASQSSPSKLQFAGSELAFATGPPRSKKHQQAARGKAAAPTLERFRLPGGEVYGITRTAVQQDEATPEPSARSSDLPADHGRHPRDDRGRAA